MTESKTTNQADELPGGVKLEPITTDPERELAIKTANIILEDAGRDPDSTESMLSRQFLRALEKIAYLESSVLAWRAQANAKC